MHSLIIMKTQNKVLLWKNTVFATSIPKTGSLNGYIKYTARDLAPGYPEFSGYPALHHPDIQPQSILPDVGSVHPAQEHNRVV